MLVIDKIITDKNLLRQISRSTDVREIRRLDLVARLRRAAKRSQTPAAGLAAIQIGIPIRFAWFKHNKLEHKLINAGIIEKKRLVTSFGEGCLSIPGYRRDVPRYWEITYASNGVIKTAKGLKAIIIQHEIDHMNGILICDR